MLRNGEEIVAVQSFLKSAGCTTGRARGMGWAVVWVVRADRSVVRVN